jgi:hypothetical protein
MTSSGRPYLRGHGRLKYRFASSSFVTKVHSLQASISARVLRLVVLPYFPTKLKYAFPRRSSFSSYFGVNSVHRGLQNKCSTLAKTTVNNRHAHELHLLSDPTVAKQQFAHLVLDRLTRITRTLLRTLSRASPCAREAPCGKCLLLGLEVRGPQ